MTQVLLTGIFFAVIGLCTLIFKKQKKSVGLIPLIIGLAVIVVSIAGPLSKSQQKINSILKLDRKNVTGIVISPTKYKGYEEINLTNGIIEIEEKKTIDSLCIALTSAKTTSTIIKNPKWVCLVSIKKLDSSVLILQVKNAGQNTIIDINSNGDYGWKYGTLDANYFGELLVNLIK